MTKPPPSALPTSAGNEKLADELDERWDKASLISIKGRSIHVSRAEIDKIIAALRTPAPEAEAMKAVMELYEWKSAVLDKCKASDGFDSLKWGGNKEGWGFIHYFIGHLETRALHAETVLKEQDAALSRPPFEAEIIAADKAKPEASFDNAGDMLAYLNDESPLEAGSGLRQDGLLARRLDPEAIRTQGGLHQGFSNDGAPWPRGEGEQMPLDPSSPNFSSLEAGERAGVGGREAIARIIDPRGWNYDDCEKPTNYQGHLQDIALTKADAILALPSQPPAEAIVEECAKLIEQHQERITETSNGSERSLSPRMAGNQMGLAYAAGIRALAQPNRTEET